MLISDFRIQVRSSGKKRKLLFHHRRGLLAAAAVSRKLDSPSTGFQEAPHGREPYAESSCARHYEASSFRTLRKYKPMNTFNRSWRSPKVKSVAALPRIPHARLPQQHFEMNPAFEGGSAQHWS
jgi:hypothetical protein